MSTTVFLAVLAAAAMHASWNAMLKVRGDRFVMLLLMCFGMGVAAAPLLPFVTMPHGVTWIWIALSVCLQTGYKYYLTRAYETGDLALAYPLARGSAPLLTALGSAVFIGELPGSMAIVGILALCGGVLLMSLRGRGEAFGGRPVLFALVTSAFIAAYTLTDGTGARSAADGISYAVWLFVVDGVVSLALCLMLRGWSTVRFGLAQWRVVLGGGCLAALGYGIVLWAMTRAPIAAVAALRETSILFAMILSVVLLGEKVAPRRVFAALIIVGGVVALRLG